MPRLEPDMETDSIRSYLRSLRRRLRWQGLADPETLAEIESHLLEAVEEGEAQGLSHEEARRRALERFGSAKTVASAFIEERMTPMQKVLLAVAVLFGWFAAWVDSRPTWDDTGVLAFGLVAAAGLLALLGCRRPWLLGLAIGLWIPARDIYLSHDWAMLLVLLFPLAGAYAGWALRLGIRKTLHMA
jgi:hypothetical protein